MTEEPHRQQGQTEPDQEGSNEDDPRLRADGERLSGERQGTSCQCQANAVVETKPVHRGSTDFVMCRHGSVESRSEEDG
ncbi:hypothetical protein GCM10010425_69490 [Streptomyces spororaveus]|uniref:Uncharacterized protein n=1 Tax=Streptomyces spororaveus TaxID=284039 RepID=A0ABQ3TLX9_9ACTN|nr:hypothetical protein Sspor_69900 [Streptomyces spororaveus]